MHAYNIYLLLILLYGKQNVLWCVQILTKNIHELKIHNSYMTFCMDFSFINLFNKRIIKNKVLLKKINSLNTTYLKQKNNK